MLLPVLYSFDDACLKCPTPSAALRPPLLLFLSFYPDAVFLAYAKAYPHVIYLFVLILFSCGHPKCKYRVKGKR